MCFAARSKHAFGPGACDGVSDQSVPPVRLQRGTERNPEPARAPRADGERAVQLSDGRRASWAQSGEVERPSLMHPLPVSVSEGPCCCGQNHEGPGHQRRRPGGLWRVCVPGCGTIHRLWAVLSDAHEEGWKNVKRVCLFNRPGECWSFIISCMSTFAVYTKVSLTLINVWLLCPKGKDYSVCRWLLNPYLQLLRPWVSKGRWASPFPDKLCYRCREECFTFEHTLSQALVMQSFSDTFFVFFFLSGGTFPP